MINGFSINGVSINGQFAVGAAQTTNVALQATVSRSACRWQDTTISATSWADQTLPATTWTEATTCE